MRRLWHRSRIKLLKFQDRPPRPHNNWMAIPEKPAKEVKPFLSFPIFFHFSFLLCVLLTLRYTLRQGIWSKCHYARAVGTWRGTSRESGKGPDLIIRERRMENTVNCGHTTHGFGAQSSCRLLECKVIHSNLARHQGLKHAQGSGTTGAHQDQANHLASPLSSSLWDMTSLPASVPPDWIFILSPRCAHFFIQYVFSTYCTRGRKYGSEQVRHDPCLHLSRHSSGKDK